MSSGTLTAFPRTWSHLPQRISGRPYDCTVSYLRREFTLHLLRESVHRTNERTSNVLQIKKEKKLRYLINATILHKNSRKLISMLKYHKYKIGMEIVSRLLLVLILNTLWVMTSYAAPLLDTKDIWNRNVFTSVIKTACSSDGQCWEWLPMLKTYDGNIIISEEDGNNLRLQSRRHVTSPASEFTLKSWKDDTLVESGREVRASLPISKQIPTKVMKKDVFVSRSWGAGGMPFSVLYMNPHVSRSNHGVATSQRQESTATTETSFVEHPNSRIGSRNGQSTTQPRKQYWTIPQLFISYGWGPFGK